MNEYTQLAERYIAIWNEADPEARREQIAAVWADDAMYVDPMVEANGHDGIDAMIVGVREQFPGFAFRLTGDVDGHHDQLRFGWELGPAGEEAPIVGFDVAVTDQSGRIVTVLGFLDRVPAAV
jgi:hypothetical protein